MQGLWQGPRSNFEIGRAPLVTQCWGGTRHFFLLILYNFKNIGGGGEGHMPPCPPTPRSLFDFSWFCNFAPSNFPAATILNYDVVCMPCPDSSKNCAKKNGDWKSFGFILTQLHLIRAWFWLIITRTFWLQANKKFQQWTFFSRHFSLHSFCGICGNVNVLFDGQSNFQPSFPLIKLWLLLWKVISYPKVAYMTKLDFLCATIWEIMGRSKRLPLPPS